MDDLIEKVARARAARFAGLVGVNVEHVMGSMGAMYRDDARTAIRAVLEGIREPDNAMVDAARTAGEKMFAEGREPTARTDFTAMIDHLREKLDE